MRIQNAKRFKNQTSGVGTETGKIVFNYVMFDVVWTYIAAEHI